MWSCTYDDSHRRAKLHVGKEMMDLKLVNNCQTRHIHVSVSSRKFSQGGGGAMKNFPGSCGGNHMTSVLYLEVP